MKTLLDQILKEKISESPKQVPLKLPKLTKIGEDNKQSLPKLKLPKLQKI